MSSQSSQYDAKALISRICQLRLDYAGNRGKALFANHLGVSASTYNYYEKDRLPPADILVKICQVTGADIHWLLTGQSSSAIEGVGKPLPKHLSDRIVALLAEDPSAVGALTAFIDLLESKTQIQPSSAAVEQISGSPGNQMDAGDDSAKGEVAAKAENRQESSGEICVPILGCTAAGIAHYWSQAGGKLEGVTELTELIDRHRQTLSAWNEKESKQLHPCDVRALGPVSNVSQLDNDQITLVQLSEITENGVSEFVASGRIIQMYPEAFGLRVDGDSMSPQICDGDIVILSPSVEPRDGSAAVVQLHGQIGVTCKIIRRQEDKVHLIPANEKFDIKVYDEKDLVWSLAVLWRVRLQ